MAVVSREHVEELKAQLETRDKVDIKYVGDEITEELVVNDISYDSELDCIVIEVY